MPDLFRLAVASIDRPEADEHPPLTATCVAAIAEAGERGADLVVLPEEPDIVAGGEHGVYTLEEHPAFGAFRDQAAQCRIGVVSSLSTKVGGRHANTGFLLDRGGEVVGLYRKKPPAPTEEAILTEPVRPGEPFPVFEFEGVRLGMALCMDIHFPEMFRVYGLRGADLVCVPTMYLDYTGDLMESLEKARAIDSGMYLAVSRYISQPFLAGKNMGYAKVVAPDGRVIVSTAHTAGVAVAEFDPKWRMRFWGEGYGGNMRTLYDTIRRPDLYEDLVKPKGPQEAQE